MPAFRPPQARNAATTLAVMGAIAITMFLGISWLATHVGGVAARRVGGCADRDRGVRELPVGFYVVQVFTALILILAAHRVPGLPRLASILARDQYLPSQFVNRGDRLVLNGVIVLAVLSCLMIYAFDAELSTLINFYVVVFTSFTLSQAGMVRLAGRTKEGRTRLPGLAPRDGDQCDRRVDDLRRPDRGDRLESPGRGVTRS